MKPGFHGILSLATVFAVILISLIYLLTISVKLGCIYIVIILAANPVLLYSYCARCQCREDACSHFFPGKIAGWLPARKRGPYTFGDYLGTALALVGLLGFPQIWLWQNKALFVIFWVLLTASLLEILFLVCPECKNDNCPNCKFTSPEKPAGKC
jgi:hypothetical protein